MKRRWQALIALPPAFLLCGMSMLTLAAPTVESPLYALAALMGTIGLIWAILGVEPGQRWTVVMLLVIGVSAMSWRLMWPAIDSFGKALTLLSQSDPIDVLRLVLVAWLILGPLTVGVVHIISLIRQAARSPNISLERTREG